MSPSSLSDWLAWAGIVLPLATLAWSALWFVRIEAEKSKKARYDQFFLLMEQLGRKEYSIAAKLAAANALRAFPEYKDVIIRLMCDAHIDGGDAHLLAREFDLTARHFGSVGRRDIRADAVPTSGDLA
jgi:hypothetical protein